MQNNTANLNIMIKAARKAARSLIRDFNEVEKLQVVSKSAGDFVSKADIRAEEIIKEELLNSRPTYGWKAEESSEIFGDDPTRRWIVDPLDGTTNFLHGLPHWAISIALEHKKSIVAAVIYDPIKDELFSAEKGDGAWVNGQRLRVSNRTIFQEMLFVTGIPFGGAKNLQETLREINSLMPLCAGLRRNGSASLDLAYVGAGRFDGYWERNLSIWDIAAGVLIVKEAGGILESIEINKDPLTTGNLICSNNQQTVFEKFSTIIRDSI
jgi:myo-inositol-1(or 4)-monophosphatase